MMPEPEDAPLLAPVAPNLTFAAIHAYSQQPLRGAFPAGEPEPLISVVRRSAAVRRGTRMTKILSGRQLVTFLQGRGPSGFCYRSSDIAGIRTATALTSLTGDAAEMDHGSPRPIFALRWRAVDPSDYVIPFAASIGELPSFAGLADIPPHDRMGPQILGTGFAPSSQHLIPEFVTHDLADLPMPANASIVALTPDGGVVTLYTYVAEQRAWARMYGAQWRHLVAGIPDIAPDQEYVQIPSNHSGASRLVGRFRGELFDALADPPHEFRVLAKARAARYPVETLARRTKYVTWRGALCTVVRADGDWLRVRMCRPDRDSGPKLAAQCVERGLYEAWAPAAETRDNHEAEHAYTL
jgi:hypothetical protein